MSILSKFGKSCLVCNVAFSPNYLGRVYCSPRCHSSAIKIRAIMGKKGVTFEEAKKLLRQRFIEINSKKCIDCGKLPVAIASGIRCHNCLSIKNGKIGSKRERMHDMVCKCIKCGIRIRNRHILGGYLTGGHPILCKEHDKEKKRLIAKYYYENMVARRIWKDKPPKYQKRKK